MDMCELDNEVFENCVSNSIVFPLCRNNELKTMDFEECSFDEDLFNESVKNKLHSTELFSNDTVVPYSDVDDMECDNIKKCNSIEKIRSEKCDDNNSVSLISTLENLRPLFKSSLDVSRFKEKKSESNKPVESSIIVIDSSLENSPLFTRSVNQDNRILTTTSGCKGILNKSLFNESEPDQDAGTASLVEVNSSNSQSRHSDVIIINSDSDETDSDQQYPDKNLSQLIASSHVQDDNAPTASVIKVKSKKSRSRHSDVIIINSDSDEDDVRHVKTEYCFQSFSNSTRLGTNENVPDLFSKQALRNDLATRVQSLLAEDERLKSQILEALMAVANTQAELTNVNGDAHPDKRLHLQRNLLRHQDSLQELHRQKRTVTSELSKLLDCTSRINQQQVESVHQRARNKKQSHQLWNELPTSTTNIACLGQRALETHRTQQALTLKSLKTLYKSLETCPSVDTMSTDPEGLLVELMPHQKHALSWLLWREKQEPSGGILADDMGLGKTLTMISLVLKSNEEKLKNTEQTDGSDNGTGNKENTYWTASSEEKYMKEGKTLVVCPATLLGQWENEINKRVKPGVLDVELHHGSNREKLARRLARKDVVISTYSIVMRDFGDMGSEKYEKAVEKGPLFHVCWERVILDEAHQVRNYKSKTAVAVCNLRAKYRWALTGTPIHNKEVDLFALLKFLRCSPFDDIRVWRRWVDNQDAAGLQRLSTITKSLMLRRTKKDLQAKGFLQTLKDKSVSLIYVKLDDEELKVYEKILDFSKTLLAQYLYQKAEKENMLTSIPVPSNRHLCTVESPFKKHPELARLYRRMTNMSDIKTHVVLVLLLRLRQICCHLSLMKSMLDEEICQQDGIDESEILDLDLTDRMNTLLLDNDSEPESNGVTQKTAFLSSDNIVFAEDRLSSKVRCMLPALQEILCTRDKVVIVSQWTSMLNIIHSILQGQNINCALFTGSVPVKQRMAIVDDFNSEHHGAKVLLLSLTAGGVGLNLVGANHLMLLDLHWNPQLETQACDRIYRVGQKKSVKIYKFICSDTIEENILKLQEKKLAVADNVLTGAKFSQMSKLTLTDLKMLFNFP